MLKQLVEALSKFKNGNSRGIRNVVVLIDEYDNPLNDSLGEPYFSEIHEELRLFYKMMKALSPYIYFLLITGIAKYAQTSIFSGNYFIVKSH